MKEKILILIIVSIILVNLVSLVQVSALTITSVTSNPKEIKPGERVSLSLRIENNLEQDAEEVSISLDLEDVPFAPYQSSNEASFEEIREGREKEVRFELITLSDADSGTYKIPVEFSYIIDEDDKTSSGLISLIINAEAEIDVSVEDSLLLKGKNAELTIKIINSGLGDARLLSLKIDDTIGIKIISENDVYIGNIDSDDFDSADFQVFISKNAPSSISLPVKISYLDSRNNEFEEDKNLLLRTYTEKEAVNLGLIQKSMTSTYIGIIVLLIILYLIYRRLRKIRRLKKE